MEVDHQTSETAVSGVSAEALDSISTDALSILTTPAKPAFSVDPSVASGGNSGAQTPV